MVLNTTLFKNCWEEEDGIIMNTLSGRYENNRVVTLGAYALYNQQRITELILPHAVNIGQYACANLSNCSYIELDWSNITTIGQYAFRSCSHWSVSLDCPNCTMISSYAFYGCIGITKASFPKCTTIQASAFVNCQYLTEGYFPNCTTMSGSAFQNCYRLSSIYLPKCGNVQGYALTNCSALTYIRLDACTTIQVGGLRSTPIKTAILPRIANISGNAFGTTAALTVYASWTTSSPTGVAANAFVNCTGMKSLYLMGSTIFPLGNTNAFNNNPCSFYVPSSLYASYIVSTNWVTYSARFVSMTDSEIDTVLYNIGLIPSSLSITFDTNGDVIYDVCPLNGLKQYLTIEGTFTDGTREVSNYVLSGSMDIGTNTITVTVGRLTTATFTVTVESSPQYVYKLPAAQLFNGTSDYIDTGVQLCDTDKSFTIFVDFNQTTVTTDKTLIHCQLEASPYPGVCIDVNSSNLRKQYYGTISTTANTNRHRIMITHTVAEQQKCTWYMDNDTPILHTGTTAYSNFSRNTLLGCYQNGSGQTGTKGRYWNGNIYNCIIWTCAVPQEIIRQLMNQ